MDMLTWSDRGEDAITAASPRNIPPRWSRADGLFIRRWLFYGAAE